MREWQVRQQIYHQLVPFNEIGDALEDQIIREEFNKNEIIKAAIEYPTVQREYLSYPGKSYAIAITYAKLLEKHFNEDFYSCLDRKDLLYSSDHYHVIYSQDPETYDEIIDKFPFDVLNNPADLGSKDFNFTINYFLKEFLLHDETKIFLPS